jgi:hypothetical protein
MMTVKATTRTHPLTTATLQTALRQSKLAILRPRPANLHLSIIAACVHQAGLIHQLHLAMNNKGCAHVAQ